MALLIVSTFGGFGMASEHQSTTLYMQRVMRGGVLIDKAHTAIALASVFIEDLYGSQELLRQQPSTATDDGRHWVVEGNYNTSKANEGAGSVRIVIDKADGRLMDATLPYIMFTHRSMK